MRALSLAGFAALLALASCADEPSPAAENAGKGGAPIRMQVAIDNAYGTRSDTLPGQTTTGSINDFSLWAYYDGVTSPYINNVSVSRGVGDVWTPSAELFWPQKPISFFALAPAGAVSNLYVQDDWQFLWFRYRADGSQDLCYAVSTGRSEAQGDVQLNFRHALAQVRFLVSSADPSVLIYMKLATLCNPVQTASYRLPTSSTLGTPSDSTITVQYDALTADRRDIMLNHGTAQVIGSTAKDVCTNNCYYFAPQVLDDDVRLALQIHVTDLTTGKQLWPSTSVGQYGIRYIEIADYSTSAGWQAGYRYDYHIRLYPRLWTGSGE